MTIQEKPESIEEKLWGSSPFHVMTKPIGPVCNLDCEYCYYLPKHDLYPGNNKWRMTEDTLEQYIRQYIQGQPKGEVVFGWQGGEPTLMGLAFFEKIIEFQKKYSQPGKTILNTLQTNGTLLNKDWCDFFRENKFLIGISIDGPPRLHDKWRLNRKGVGSSAEVLRGLRLMKRYEVEFNILCTVHRANQDHPHECYHYFKELGSKFVQFIPIVEQLSEGGVSHRSVEGAAYGDFLCGVFDEWIRHDVGEYFIQIFDVSLGAWHQGQSSLCVFSEVCGRGLALEHNGDLYACDHYVETDYLLGNLHDMEMIDLVNQKGQREFGNAKRDTLSQQCIECNVKFACQGGCPKNRFIPTNQADKPQNYLCPGYYKFFNHIDPYMKVMSALLHRQRSPMDIMPIVRKYGTVNERAMEELFAPPGRGNLGRGAARSTQKKHRPRKRRR